jgi:phenylacetaldehyde dehydrogenase
MSPTPDDQLSTTSPRDAPAEVASASALRAEVSKINSGQLFIGGAFRDAEGGRTRNNVDPSTGETTTTIAEASVGDVDSAVAAARVAFDRGPWSRMDPVGRGAVLLRIADGIRNRIGEFALRETVDVGKPITSTRAFDVPQASDLFAYYGALANQLDGSARPGIDGSLVYTRLEPLGVVGAISPFNFQTEISGYPF